MEFSCVGQPAPTMHKQDFFSFPHHHRTQTKDSSSGRYQKKRSKRKSKDGKGRFVSHGVATTSTISVAVTLERSSFLPTGSDLVVGPLQIGLRDTAVPSPLRVSVLRRLCAQWLREHLSTHHHQLFSASLHLPPNCSSRHGHQTVEARSFGGAESYEFPQAKSSQEYKATTRGGGLLIPSRLNWPRGHRSEPAMRPKSLRHRDMRRRY